MIEKKHPHPFPDLIDGQIDLEQDFQIFLDETYPDGSDPEKAKETRKIFFAAAGVMLVRCSQASNYWQSKFSREVILNKASAAIKEAQKNEKEG